MRTLHVNQLRNSEFLMGRTPIGRIEVALDHTGCAAVCVVNEEGRPLRQIGLVDDSKHPLESIFGKRPGEPEMLVKFRNEFQTAQDKKLKEQKRDISKWFTREADRIFNWDGPR